MKNRAEYESLFDIGYNNQWSDLQPDDFRGPCIYVLLGRVFADLSRPKPSSFFKESGNCFCFSNDLAGITRIQRISNKLLLINDEANVETLSLASVPTHYPAPKLVKGTPRVPA